MSLQEKLKKHRAKFEEHAKPEVLEVMRRAKSDLRNSGILDRAELISKSKYQSGGRLENLYRYRG